MCLVVSVPACECDGMFHEKILPSLKPNEKSRVRLKRIPAQPEAYRNIWLSSCPACEIEGNSLGNFRPCL